MKTVSVVGEDVFTNQTPLLDLIKARPQKR